MTTLHKIGRADWMILVELCFITVSAVLIFNHILLYVILRNIEVRYASLECQHIG